MYCGKAITRKLFSAVIAAEVNQSTKARFTAKHTKSKKLGYFLSNPFVNFVPLW